MNKVSAKAFFDKLFAINGAGFVAFEINHKPGHRFKVPIV